VIVYRVRLQANQRAVSDKKRKASNGVTRGLEYRFTPNIGVFGEAGYNWVGGGQHSFNSSVKDFIQVNFGLRYAI